MKKIYILYVSFLTQIILCNNCFATQIIADSTAILKERTFDPNFKDKYKYDYQGKEVNKKPKDTKGTHSPYGEGKEAEEIEENNTNEFSFIAGSLFQTIAIIAFVIGIIFLVYILVGQGIVSPFSSKRSKEIQNSEDFTPDDIENTNIDTLIINAENNGNYRLAIRYQYLSVLKSLSEKGVIEYKADKTNAEYQYEISELSYSKDFSYISYLYNYTWYGEFNVNDIEYNIAKNNFSNLKKSIRG